MQGNFFFCTKVELAIQYLRGVSLSPGTIPTSTDLHKKKRKKMADSSSSSTTTSSWASMLTGKSDAEIEELLDRMLTRLALCDDSKLQDLLTKLLPLSIASLSSSAPLVRNKVITLSQFSLFNFCN